MKDDLFVILSFLLTIITAGCSNDDSMNDSVDFDNTQCYTIRINGIDENGVVLGSVIDRPENSDLMGFFYILFDKSDLLGQTVESGDEIKIMILSYEDVPVAGYTTGITHGYYCKIHLIK